VVNNGTGIQWKSVSYHHTIHPAWWAGGCWFTHAKGLGKKLAHSWRVQKWPGTASRMNNSGNLRLETKCQPSLWALAFEVIFRILLWQAANYTHVDINTSRGRWRGAFYHWQLLFVESAKDNPKTQLPCHPVGVHKLSHSLNSVCPSQRENIQIHEAHFLCVCCM